MDTTPAPRPRRRVWRALKKLTMVAAALLVIAAVISAINNQRLPTRSQSVERLDAQQQLLLAETLKLKRELGNAVWPGWGDAPIPVLLYNEQYGFLTSPPDVPGGGEVLAGDAVLQQPYYRITGQKHEAFAVRVGAQWAGSMNTKEWMRISLTNKVRRQLPWGVKTIFPYPIVTWVLGLTSSETHISMVLHENFHAFQATSAPQRFADAMAAYAVEKRYPWNDAAVQHAWEVEIGLLAEALEAQSPEQTASLARRFVEQRRARRGLQGFDAALIAYERRMEWLEGMAKYVELGVWRQAAMTASYKPLPQMAADREFKNYATFPTRWSREVMNLKMQGAQQGDTRFYYTGMAQGYVLDRLMPDWKARAFQEDIGLEELLAAAVVNR